MIKVVPGEPWEAPLLPPALQERTRLALDGPRRGGWLSGDTPGCVAGQYLGDTTPSARRETLTEPPPAVTVQPCPACGTPVTGGHFARRVEGMILEPCGCVFVQNAAGVFISPSRETPAAPPPPARDVPAWARQDPLACRTCLATGTRLYEGGLCEGCWELHELQATAPAPAPAPVAVPRRAPLSTAIAVAAALMVVLLVLVNIAVIIVLTGT